MKVFVGYDTREDIAYQVCKHSLESRNDTVEVIPLIQSKLRDQGWYTRPIDKLASTEFTFTRFMVPALAEMKGWALFIHCDFVAVDETKPVVMEIPVRVVGNAPGVRAGGKLVKKLNRLRVRGLIQDLPDFIDVSIDTLEIGQSAKVSNVVVSGFELLDSPANAILSIKTTRALMQAAADAAKK